MTGIRRETMGSFLEAGALTGFFALFVHWVTAPSAGFGSLAAASGFVPAGFEEVNPKPMRLAEQRLTRQTWSMEFRVPRSDSSDAGYIRFLVLGRHESYYSICPATRLAPDAAGQPQ